MTPVDCTAARDAAPELALGILDGAERAEVLLHVAGCPACQAYVSDLAVVADGLASLAPEVEPPFGFSRRVDAAIRGPRRHLHRRVVTGVAAAMAAAAIAVAALTGVVGGGSSTPVAAPTLRTVSMIGDGGARVGRVAVAGATRASLAVTVDYAVPDGTYALQLTAPDGSSTRVGWITISGGRGQWVGTTTLPHQDDVNLQLVAATGTVVCHAQVTETNAS